jgi:hypothetical protein
VVCGLFLFIQALRAVYKYSEIQKKRGQLGGTGVRIPPTNLTFVWFVRIGGGALRFPFPETCHPVSLYSKRQ